MQEWQLAFASFMYTVPTALDLSLESSRLLVSRYQQVWNLTFLLSQSSASYIKRAPPHQGSLSPNSF